VPEIAHLLVAARWETRHLNTYLIGNVRVPQRRVYMSEQNGQNLPAQIADALAGLPKALVPASLKALDRLLGAGVDIPVAWLAQKKARIDAQTRAYAAVEDAIALTASKNAGENPEIVGKAVEVLVRKTYRQHQNKTFVAAAMIEDLSTPDQSASEVNGRIDIDEDWLNVFERYAEDASSERMQKLWGRVIAGELRRPGQFSLRTLRFLSEFSQADALSFSKFCEDTFSDLAPNSLVNPENQTNIRDLMYMESSGLIQGAGLGFRTMREFNESGRCFIREGDLVLVFEGVPDSSFQFSAIALTPLGQELITLLPGRDPRAAARKVALAIKCPQTKTASIGVITNSDGNVALMEVIWKDDGPTVPAEG